MGVNYEKLGKRISKYRNEKEWSQAKLAEEVLSSRKHISLIETGNTALSVELLTDIANALEVSADDLLVDSLTHSASTAGSEIHQMLTDCNKIEEEILTEMVKALSDLHERWKKIHHRLRNLDSADQEKEADLLSKAYDMLLSAYQESRELNDEMELLIKNTLIN